ncbi:hypothetical protein FHX82_004594 [Amycolatopsis bartoniae]|uniref:DUF4192 domain-containing protein n=1 Tax=Amycolatopsis bartoniae TaxID=941986 RepID=A0A8H9M8C2_9PSEU|nr:DUF4192 domain-containing protein [Amycolatopsis bartoniae]MBB2937521.1 hypothetical protein [Amycolatopsis bartoniae]GHF81918.1 hypothetical protein GCM10017566_65000 [Amycolatopsis bartoniae]
MTTTTILSDRPYSLILREPAQMIAALPPLLGFRPANSLIVLGLGGPGGQQLQAIVRADLPEQGKERDIIKAVTRMLATQPPKTVEVILIGRHPAQPPPPTGPPHRDLVALLATAFATLGARVRHTTWAPEIRKGATWCCYHEDGCEGVLPDELSTVAAAAFALDGKVTFSSREELVRLLSPDDPEALQRRAELLNSALKATDPSIAQEELRPQRAETVRSALETVKRQELSLSDEQIVDLAMALSDSLVRDACLATARDPAWNEHAERLWEELVRSTPAPERAEPAVLLAYSAYIRGEGALAGIALDNALEADPGNTMAGLLFRCLAAGVPPERLRALAQHEDTVQIRPAGDPP